MANPTLTRGYRLNVLTGEALAVEFQDGWIPVRQLGPLTPEQLATEIGSLDFAGAVAADRLNVRYLVMLCDAERARIMRGEPRRTIRAAAKAAAMPDRPVDGQIRKISELRKAASDALRETSEGAVPPLAAAEDGV